MRISSQNNQFIFDLPSDFISKRLEDKFQSLLDKNMIPYNDIIDYLSSTIKEIVFPSLSFEKTSQKLFHGKNISWREAGNIMDKLQGEIDITFRSVDSHLNYFILMENMFDKYLDTQNEYIPELNIKILDKHGDLIYTILLKEIILLSLSELRMSYNYTEFNEQTFSLQFTYNFIDIIWEIKNNKKDDSISVFDLPINKVDPYDYNLLNKEMKKRKEDSLKNLD